MAEKVVAIVGMPGSGKSEVAAQFEQSGFTRIRFGDVTDAEVEKRGLELNEKNERAVRESLRREHGVTAYAKLNQPRIESALKNSDVVVDGLYSWEEYLYLKECYGENFHVVAVWASPDTRHSRLAAREVRGLSREEAAGRDKAEIENLNKAGPIAMADFTIVNETTLDELVGEANKIIARIKE